MQTNQPNLAFFSQEPGCTRSRAHPKARGRLYSARGFSRWPKRCHLGHCGFLFDSRCYCFECVDTLVGPGTSEKVQATSNWVCFLCLPSPRNGLLQRRRKWRERLKAFYDEESVRAAHPTAPPAAGAPAWLALSGLSLQNAHLLWNKRRLGKCGFSLTAGSPRLVCSPMTLAGGGACAEPGNEVFVA